jgi:flavodoxin
LGGSQVIMNKKPELISLKTDLKEYDTVFLGSPIWAGRYVPAIKTLLEEGELKGKKIAFFYCHRGGPGKADEKIKKEVQINNEFISSHGLTRAKENFESLKEDVLSWAKDIKEKISFI